MSNKGEKNLQIVLEDDVNWIIIIRKFSRADKMKMLLLSHAHILIHSYCHDLFCCVISG